MAFHALTLLLIVLFPLSGMAQSPSGLSVDKPVLTITDYVAPVDSVFNSHASYIFSARVKRYFLRHPLYKAKQSQAIINHLFSRAMIAYASGNNDQSTTILRQLADEQATFGLLLAAHIVSTATPADIRLRESLISDEAIRLSYLPTSAAIDDFGRLIARLRTDSLRTIDAEINESKLDEEAKTAKLNRMVEDFGRKTLKTDANIAQKFVLVGELKLISHDTDLELLDKLETNLMVQTSKLSTRQLIGLAKIVRAEGELEPSLGVIQKLANSAPSVRSEIEGEITPLVKEIVTRIESKPENVATLLRVVTAAQARSDIIKKIESENKKKEEH